MELLKKILVPIDVNTDTAEQMKTTIKLANAYNSEIILMYVIGDTDLNDCIKSIVVKSVTESLNEIKEVLIRNDVRVREPLVIYGKIVDAIVQKANLERVDLIIIGSEEKKKSEKFKLGVIAEQIIREADVPVWLVNSIKKNLLSHILCPVDFSESSRQALATAVLLARKFNASLKIITVYEPLKLVSIRIKINLKEENATRMKVVKNEMKAFVKEFDLEGVNHKIEIKCGKVSDKILRVIKKQDIDLLIMGTNGRTKFSRFFLGSVTEKVIREMPCSFITTKIDE